MKTYRKPIVTLDEEGNEIARYPSRNDCAKALGITPATLNYRLTNGRTYNGIVCKYLQQEEVKQPKEEKPVRHIKEIDYNKDYRMVTYETKFNRICITPCPFRDKMNNVMVGSAKCEQCASFKGKDREKHIVSCNFKQWSKQTIKAWLEN